MNGIDDNEFIDLKRKLHVGCSEDVLEKAIRDTILQTPRCRGTHKEQFLMVDLIRPLV